MLKLDCTDCKTSLELDDAFAGGVCRCVHCGTIQTVPKNLPPVQPPEPAMPQPAKRTSKSEAPAGHATASSFNETLLWRIFYGLVLSVIVAGAVAVWLASRPSAPRSVSAVTVSTGEPRGEPRSDESPPKTDSAPPPPEQSAPPVSPPLTPAPPDAPSDPITPAPAPPASANFCGFELGASRVIYVIDRSSLAAPVFEPGKKAVAASLRSLQPDQRFQIVYWSLENEPLVSIPSDGMANATPAVVRQALADLDKVQLSGSETKMKGAIAYAVEQNPERIAFIHGKKTLPEFADRLLAIRGSAPIRFDTFCLAEPESVEAMKMIADKTGGQFHMLSLDQLSAAGR